MSTAGEHAGKVTIVLKKSGKDQRRYNLPTSTDVAAIMPANEETPQKRDTVLYRRANDDPAGHVLKWINETHRMYDPLQYVLLIPHRDIGWQINITLEQSKQNMSPMLFNAQTYCTPRI